MADKFEKFLMNWRSALRYNYNHGYFNNINEIETLTDVLAAYRRMRRALPNRSFIKGQDYERKIVLGLKTKNEWMCDECGESHNFEERKTCKKSKKSKSKR